MIDGPNVFDQPVKNNLINYDNIRETATGQRDDYIPGCLLDYRYFKNYQKMIAIDLSKQQALDTDWKAIQYINVTANLDRSGDTTMFFTIEEAKEIILDFHKELWKYCEFNLLQYNISIKWLGITP